MRPDEAAGITPPGRAKATPAALAHPTRSWAPTRAWRKGRPARCPRWREPPVGSPYEQGPRGPACVNRGLTVICSDGEPKRFAHQWEAGAFQGAPERPGVSPWRSHGLDCNALQRITGPKVGSERVAPPRAGLQPKKDQAEQAPHQVSAWRSQAPERNSDYLQCPLRIGVEGARAYKYRFFTSGSGHVPALGVFVVFDVAFPLAFSSWSNLKIWAVSGAR